MATELFLDTAYAIALAAPGDRHHQRAVELAETVQRVGTRLVTTRAVWLEIGDALSKRAYRPAAAALLAALERDPSVTIVPLTEDVYQRGFSLFCKREDKEWGITDCISFVVMQDRGIADALTTDEHFQQAGFNALLR